jgi:alpha-beta hydrolase superfamily lysophospholipase
LNATPSAEMAAATRSRAVAAGIDVHEYDAVTATLTSLDDWCPTFRATAATHVRSAVRARDEGRTVTAGGAFLTASLWYYFAGSWPTSQVSTYQESAQAQRAALDLLDPTAERVEGDRFRGVLRRPDAHAGTAPLVVLVPGLDGAKEELFSISEALLARGCATFAIDGPGQGELVGVQPPAPDYPAVVGAALDRLADLLPTTPTGVLACSLGGLYATATLAVEPRLAAGVVVSGLVKAPPYDHLPPLIRALLGVRAASEEDVRAFAASLDVSEAAPAIEVPLLVVDGDADPLVNGDFTGQWLSEHVPDAQRRVVPGGDHNIANARGQWLPDAADWLVERLRSTRDDAVPA